MAMTDSAQLRYWKEQIHRGIAHQEKYGNSPDWKKWDNYYLGRWSALDEKLAMNYMFAQFRALIPQTYYRNPRVSVVPRKAGFDAHSKVLEAVLNWLIQEMAVKSQLKRAMLDALLYGTGFLKLGYDSQSGVTPAALIQEPLPLPDGTTLDMTGESLTQRDDEFKRIEYHADVAPGRPWALREHPVNIVVDPCATDVFLSDAKWFAHRVLRRVDDVKADKKYEHAKNLKPNRSDKYNEWDEAALIESDGGVGEYEGDGRGTGRSKRVIDEYVELWEVHDRKTEHVMALNLDHHQFLRDEQDVLQIDGLPIIPIIFNPNPESFWGISDAQVLHPQQVELNHVRRMQQGYRIAALRRLIAKKGLFTREQREKFFSTDIEGIIEPSGEAEYQDLDGVIKELQGYIPPDLGVWGDQVEADMRDLLGVGRNQMGDYDAKTHRSATEANIVNDNSRVRVDERRDILSDVLARVLRRASQMVFEWWNSEDVRRVAGPGGAMFWVRYTGAELKGEYDFDIQPDDSLPLTRRQRVQDMVQLAQAVAPMLLPPQLQQLARSILSVSEGIDVNAILNPQAAMGVPLSLDEFGAMLQQQGVQQPGMMPPMQMPMGEANAGLPVPMQQPGMPA